MGVMEAIQSTSSPVMFQLTFPLLPIFLTSNVKTDSSVPKSNFEGVISIFDVFFSTSAVIFNDTDSLSAFTIIVSSLFSVSFSRNKETCTAQLLPASNAPLAGFTSSQSTLSRPDIFQLNFAVPLLKISKEREVLFFPKFKVEALSSIFASFFTGASVISPIAFLAVTTLILFVLVT